jgi:hypothetical protein
MHITGTDANVATYGNEKFNLAPTSLDDVWQISVFVRASEPTTCQLFAFEADINGNQHSQGGVFVQTFDVTTRWELVTMNVTISNPNTKFIQVRLDGPDSGGVGKTLWFDGLQVKKLVDQENFHPYPTNIGFWARNAVNVNSTIAIDTTVTSPAGSTPLKLTATGANAKLGTITDNERPEYSVAPINAGQTWVCSVLVKAQTPGTSAALYAAVADSSHEINASIMEIAEVAITEEWQKISLEITVTDSSAAFLRVAVGAKDSGTIFWFDDLKVVPKAQETLGIWNDRATYLLRVDEVLNDNEILVSPKYSGPAPYPAFPTTSSIAKPIFVKQVNLVDSVNTIYTNAMLGLRRILIRSIGMS